MGDRKKLRRHYVQAGRAEGRPPLAPRTETPEERAAREMAQRYGQLALPAKRARQANHTTPKEQQ